MVCPWQAYCTTAGTPTGGRAAQCHPRQPRRPALSTSPPFSSTAEYPLPLPAYLPSRRCRYAWQAAQPYSVCLRGSGASPSSPSAVLQRTLGTAEVLTAKVLTHRRTRVLTQWPRAACTPVRPRPCATASRGRRTYGYPVGTPRVP